MEARMTGVYNQDLGMSDQMSHVISQFPKDIRARSNFSNAPQLQDRLFLAVIHTTVSWRITG